MNSQMWMKITLLVGISTSMLQFGVSARSLWNNPVWENNKLPSFIPHDQMEDSITV